MDSLELKELIDRNGYLLDYSQWTETIAIEFARQEKIKLSDKHWEIIALLQQYYDEFDAPPATRALVRYIKKKLGPEKGNSLYLMSLFPGSPVRIGSRIAGLPKPRNCL